MSQLELASEAEISTRHLSFLETGRSHASREMLLHLSEQLDIPLRERNVMLVAAGYAPVFEERPLGSPEMAAARQAVERVLKGHEPFPALAVDRHWQLVSANAAVAPLLAGVDAALLKPPLNVLRLSLHPSGLAPRIANLVEWRTHLLMRLRTQIEQTADAWLMDLLAELSKFPATNMLKPRMPPPRDETAGVFVPFQLVTRRRAELHQHHNGLRHACRRDPLRACSRVFFPGQRHDRAGAAAVIAGAAARQA